MSRLFNSLGVTQERVLHRYIPKVPSQCHCNPATGLLSFSWNKYLKHSGNALDVIVELRSKKKKETVRKRMPSLSTLYQRQLNYNRFTFTVTFGTFLEIYSMFCFYSILVSILRAHTHVHTQTRTTTITFTGHILYTVTFQRCASNKV